MSEFKLVILGDHGVGKTAFLKRHSQGFFLRDYQQSSEPELTNLNFSTSKGKLTANCWDINVGANDGYFLNTKAVILMFDLTDRRSFEKLEMLYKKVIAFCEKHTPIVLVGNKCDENHVVTKEEILNFVSKHNLHYCAVSVKTCYDFEKPFLYLMKKISGYSDLKIVY